MPQLASGEAPALFLAQPVERLATLSTGGGWSPRTVAALPDGSFALVASSDVWGQQIGDAVKLSDALAIASDILASAPHVSEAMFKLALAVVALASRGQSSYLPAGG